MNLFRHIFSIAFFICISCSAIAQQLEIPITNDTLESQEIVHTGYSVSYNQGWRLPNWVAYELTAEEAEGMVMRSGAFVPDPLAVGVSAVSDDYKYTGWDRGHMAPAADMRWSKVVMTESFYLSNVCPQNRNLNRGLWANLEGKVRKWAKAEGSVYVVCGPIVDEAFETIGENAVAVPDAFFKVLCICRDGECSAIGFIFPNTKCSGDVFDYYCSVDSVESVTGHDFFHVLDDAVEEVMERRCEVEGWDLDK